MKYLEALSLGDGVVDASGSYSPDSFFRKSGAWFKTKFEKSTYYDMMQCIKLDRIQVSLYANTFFSTDQNFTYLVKQNSLSW